MKRCAILGNATFDAVGCVLSPVSGHIIHAVLDGFRLSRSQG